MMLTACLAILAAQASPLAGDPRLAATVEVRAEAESVSAVLASIEELTKTRLTASREIADDTVVLYAKAPAREVLDRIAAHFDWTWKKIEGGYSLDQSGAQRDAERAACEDQVLRPYLKWQEAARAAVSARGQVSERIRQDLDELLETNRQHLEHYEAEYYSGDPIRRTAWSNRRAELDAKIAGIGRSLSPFWKLADEVVAGMSRQDLLDLDRLTKLVYAAPAGTLQRRIPNDAAKGLASEWLAVPDARLEGPERYVFDAMDWPYRLPDRQGDALSVWVRFRLSNVRPRPDEAHPFVETRLAFAGQGGITLAETWLDTRPPRIERTQTPRTVPQDKFDEALRATEALTSANAADRQGFLAPSSLREFLRVGSDVHPYRSTAALMIEIAAAAGVNLVADCFEAASWQGQRAVPIGTARGAFSVIAAGSDSTWQGDGAWVAFRANNWQLRRASSIKMPLMKRVRDLAVREPLTLDSHAEIAIALTDRQIENPLMFSLTRGMMPLLYSSNREKVWALRFWGSLSPAQRKGILEGQMISLGSLAAQQREALTMFLFLSDDRDLDAEVSTRDTEMGLETADAAWLDANWPQWRDQGFPGAVEPSAQLPNGVPRDALVGMGLVVADALEVSNGAGWSRTMSEANAVGSGYYKSEGVSDYLVRPTKHRRYRLTVRLSPALTKGTTLSFFDPPVGEPKPYSEQPAELQGRLERAHKIRRGG